MTVVPMLTLPRVSTAEAAYFSTLARHAAPVAVRLGGTAWEVRVEPVPDPAAVPTAWHVAVDFGGARLDVALSPGLLEEVLLALDPGGDPSVLPPVLRQALTELAFEDVADALEAACGHAVRVVAVEDGDGGTAAPHRLGLRLRRADGGGRVVQGLVACDSRGLAMVADLLSRAAPPPPAPAPWEALPVPLRLEVGRTALPLAQLRALEPNDVILLDDSRLVADDRLVLRLSTGTGIIARVAGSTLVIEDLVRTPLMTDAPEAAAPGAAEAAAQAPGEPLLDTLDDVEVVLTFDIGQHSLTVAELRALAPGAVFDLGRDARRAVTIRANGKAVGTGALVQVDDRVGVQVATLAGAAE